MNTPAFNDELMTLIGAVRDEQVTNVQMRRLEALLADSPEARREYLMAMTIHGLLEQSAACIPSEPEGTVPRGVYRSIPIMIGAVLATVAAMLLVSFAVLWQLFPADNRVAVVIDDTDAPRDASDSMDGDTPLDGDDALPEFPEAIRQPVNDGDNSSPAPSGQPQVPSFPVPPIADDTDVHQGEGAEITLLLQLSELIGEGIDLPEDDEDRDLLRHLLPEAEIIVFGKVERATEKDVHFSLHQTLRGEKSLPADDKEAALQIQCAPGVEWPIGKFCCLFLRSDPDSGRYAPVLDGDGIQTMPYLGIADVGLLGETIRLWDSRFASKSEEQRREHFAMAPAHERLVFDVVQGGNREELIKAMRELQADD